MCRRTDPGWKADFSSWMPDRTLAGAGRGPLSTLVRRRPMDMKYLPASVYAPKQHRFDRPTLDLPIAVRSLDILDAHHPGCAALLTMRSADEHARNCGAESGI